MIARRFCREQLLAGSPQLRGDGGFHQRVTIDGQGCCCRMQLPVPRDGVQADPRRQLLGRHAPGLVVEGDQMVAATVHQEGCDGVASKADVHPAAVQVPGEGGVGGQQK